MISRSIKGVCSELIAVKEFLKKGYYVARSIDPQCPFDIVVVDKKGKTSLFDVKSVSRRKTKSYNCKPGDTINRSVSKKQKSLGVKIYYAEGDQKFYYWNNYTILRYQSIYMKNKSKQMSEKQFEKELMKHIRLNNYYKDISPEERRAIMRAYFEKYEYEKKKKLN